LTSFLAQPTPVFQLPLASFKIEAASTKAMASKRNAQKGAILGAFCDSFDPF
jgi:hypothetical protein